ncbi:DNA-binding protein [Allokutzneria sp. A3M-2-11 16]|uniref:type II toxin-antitoxin system VapC family toxin n=1 Tax=Allokutzneria sp. A3M-2-11 16 TaxID=2962043 RepID=UPI0020B7688D|nr:DNA-binding protein [Allokutzneria sp. A3M-2-11 16]MCP3799776.1 DNA-binding protein [Allokutzneria sp. A3M-2-11 16]
MTLVLDCEGLAKAVQRDRELTAWLAAARAADERVVTSAATLVEVLHPRINRPAFDWVVSRLSIEPVTIEIAKLAAVLLEQAGFRGHKNAMLAATALSVSGSATVLTSDPDDMAMLCGRRVTVVKI